MPLPSAGLVHERPIHSPVHLFFYAVLFLAIYQTVHMVDHVLQYMQGLVFGLEKPLGIFEGLLDASDTVVHLWLNGIEYVAIVLLWISFREIQLKNAGDTRSILNLKNKLAPAGSIPLRVLTIAIFFLLIFQSLHIGDHVLQYIQKFMLGINSPPGVFQGLFSESDTKIHLWVNFFIFLAVIAVWISFREAQLRQIIPV
jgi:prenyltransferase beta subunit